MLFSPYVYSLLCISDPSTLRLHERDSYQQYGHRLYKYHFLLFCLIIRCFYMYTRATFVLYCILHYQATTEHTEDDKFTGKDSLRGTN